MCVEINDSVLFSFTAVNGGLERSCDILTTLGKGGIFNAWIYSAITLDTNLRSRLEEKAEHQIGRVLVEKQQLYRKKETTCT